MPHRVCPWWLGYFLISPVRRWLQNPTELLRPYVHEGMTVLEPGPGMGFFTIPLAQIVGPSGRVIAVDVQPKMIAKLKKRAARANVQDRVDARIAPPDTLGIEDLTRSVDFTLAFAMVHELPDAGKFFAEVARASRPKAKLLVVEPRGHVNDASFAAESNAASAAGFTLTERPRVGKNLTALLEKS